MEFNNHLQNMKAFVTCLFLFTLLASSVKISAQSFNNTLAPEFALQDIGVGYDFLSSLGIDFRYGLSLLNLNNTGIRISAKNRTVQIYFIVKCLKHSG